MWRVDPAQVVEALGSLHSSVEVLVLAWVLQAQDLELELELEAGDLARALNRSLAID